MCDQPSERDRGLDSGGMESLQSQPGLTSTVAGISFAALMFVLGGGDGLVGLALAAVIGGVFAVSMYAVLRARRSRSN